jgi:16S rRNA (adenine1518-N6/adenine1519-N6)-dimethyltransferase
MTARQSAPPATGSLALGRADVLALLAANGLRPRRALGQNFLCDPNTARRIARLAGIGPGEAVVEVGAGLGSLTLALAETGGRITALEVDPALVRILQNVVGPAGVEVVEGDALRVDWSSLLSSASRWTLVANLPYNVATPTVLRLLDHAPSVGRFLVMVQREVGERLAAPVGDPAYGAVSVKVAYWARAEVVGRVPASVFVPRPRVESVLVRIERRSRPAVDPGVVGAEALFRLVRAGFAQRRKMLRRSLYGLLQAEDFVAGGISPSARAEQLDVADWGRLAAAWTSRRVG